MPGGDRTGPQGMGPMTGRGAGYCRGAGEPGQASGRMGWGGGGRGWRHRFWATGQPGWMRQASAGQEPDRERQTLADQVSALSAQLDTLRARLAQMGESDQRR